MNNTKYIFLDIDGTILDSDGVVCESTREAIRIAQNNGHKVFVSTGRARKLIPQIITDIGFDGYVAATGSFVEYRDKVVFEKYFSKEQTKRVIDFLDKNKMPFIVSALTCCVGTYSSVPVFIEVWSDGKLKAEEIKDIDLVDSPFLESIQPISCDDDIHNYFDKYEKISDMVFLNSPISVGEMDKLFGDDIHIEKASFKDPDDYSGEITLQDCTKATGIQKVLEYLNAKQCDSVCIGDGYNDIDMLKYCDLSVAMGNSPDDIKAISKYVTDDINNDGVYKALKKFKLI